MRTLCDAYYEEGKSHYCAFLHISPTSDRGIVYNSTVLSVRNIEF